MNWFTRQNTKRWRNAWCVHTWSGELVSRRQGERARPLLGVDHHVLLACARCVGLRHTNSILNSYHFNVFILGPEGCYLGGRVGGNDPSWTFTPTHWGPSPRVWACVQVYVAFNADLTIKLFLSQSQRTTIILGALDTYMYPEYEKLSFLYHVNCCYIVLHELSRP